MHLNVKLKPHDVQVIVSNPMRTSSNVHTAIVAPQYTNLKLYNDAYKVTVSVPISERVFCKFKDKKLSHDLISYRGRYYIHWEKTYLYTTPFSVAFAEAESHLVTMKISGREYKISILEDEIYILSVHSL